MAIKKSTPVPNQVFDDLLPSLKESELKVLLVIIRQTLGWVANKKSPRRKCRDWITIGQFQTKTGLSRKAISTAIASLYKRGLVGVTNYKGNELSSASDRRGNMRIFYSCTLPTCVKSSSNKCKIYPFKRKNLHITKETDTKENSTKGKKRKTDFNKWKKEMRAFVDSLNTTNAKEEP